MPYLTKQKEKFLQGALMVQELHARSQLNFHLPFNDQEGLSYNGLIGEVSDENDQAAAQNLMAIDNSIAAHYYAEIKEIQAAKKRLAQGIYGNCQDCSHPISYRRLLVCPTAERCIRCQTLYEKTYAPKNFVNRVSA